MPAEAVTLIYPSVCIQSLVTPWWVVDKDYDLRVGRLVHAFVNYVDTEPWELKATGRAEPRNHKVFEAEIVPLRLGDRKTAPRLPVAAMPIFPKEVRIVQRAKVRPALVVANSWTQIPQALAVGMTGTQKRPAVLAAPFYGVDQNGTRAGFDPEFVERVCLGEYVQFLFDKLPIKGSTEESLLRFDHIQPLGAHASYVKPTEFRLSDNALQIILDWLAWAFSGEIDPDSELWTALRIINENRGT